MIDWIHGFPELLLRSTFFLSASAIATVLLIRLLRVRSATIQRAMWCLVLLQGLVWMRLDVVLPATWTPANSNASAPGRISSHALFPAEGELIDEMIQPSRNAPTVIRIRFCGSSTNIRL